MTRAALLLALVLPSALAYGDAATLAPGERLVLQDGWFIRCSAEAQKSGAALSTAGSSVQGWIPTRVPSTVLAARVAHGDFPDPGYGMNLRRLPGTSDYAIGENFSLVDMTKNNPYRASWWYRRDFELPRTDARVWLHLDGVNYRANVWINGKLAASDKQIAGAYRRFVLDVTALVHPGARNAIAVETFAPGKNDLAPSWIDWNPSPPDRNLGLWHDVYLTTTGPVRLTSAPFVVSKLPSLDEARLTVAAELTNTGDAPVTGQLRGTIDDKIQFVESVTLAAHETKALSIDPDRHHELIVKKPKLWWPRQLGTPELHDLAIDFVSDGKVSDRARARFGIREVKLELVDGKWARYRINGQPLVIRGGGYTSDFLLRFDDRRDEDELALVADLGLNTIRLEGKLANEHLFDLADLQGILVMPGWECCTAWEAWGEDEQKRGLAQWDAATHAIALESLRSQLERLRGRPSVITFVYGSDRHAPLAVEREYQEIIKQTRWPMPTQDQASERDPGPVAGPSGFKMSGPYDYVPPVYWYADKEHGGGFGFNSETGVGAAVPNLESLKKMLPPDALWPINATWNYHLGSEHFVSIDGHTRALTARYGEARTVEDYVMKAQALAYESERALFEGYRRDKQKASGVIVWMLNSAWPSLLWHLYDYYLAAGGGYYGAKKANEPIHIQYSYDDRSVVIINDTRAAVRGLAAAAELYDLHGKKLFARAVSNLTVPTDKTVVALTLPSPPNVTATSFVRLSLRDAKNRIVSQNFYWLSTKPDQLDYPKTEWWGTPIIAQADFTSLQSLARVTPTATIHDDAVEAQRTLRVTVQNASAEPAFLVRLRVTKGAGGDEVLPSLWSDNYIALLPGERRELTAHFSGAALGGAEPVVVMSGWNVPETALQPRQTINHAKGPTQGRHGRDHRRSAGERYQSAVPQPHVHGAHLLKRGAVR